MKLSSWKWLILTSATFVLCYAQDSSLECPSQELISPCRCMTRGGEYQIWCSHSDLPRVLGGIRSLGQDISKPIDELILENNNLPSLPGRAFLQLKVMRLMLRYNGLERVSNGWLSGLENSLMELYLVEPELRSLPEDSLSRLVVLQAITIQSNSVKRLPSFSGMPRLNYIQIESLSLMELSSRHFKNLPALEKIHVNGSPMLIRFEESLLQDLPSLTLFNVTYSGISWLHPRAFSRLPALRQLSLVGNKLTDAGVIGRAARNLENLESLNLDYNVIDRLNEASFVDFPSLRKLSIANNQIKDLERGAFHRVPMLRVLDLSNNLIRRVHPESFLRNSIGGLDELLLVNNNIGHVIELRSILQTLPRLVSLDLSYNDLEVLPFSSLRGHSTLERLSLEYNKLHLIEREAFNAMPALRELSLKNNSLSEALDNPLWNLPALKGLDLSGNFYRRVEPGLLTNLPSLRRVDLSVNLIDYVNPLSFLDTPALEYVNISRNRLVTLHPATFRHLLGLYEIDVSDNGLLQFIPGLPRGTEYLHVQRNRIATLPLPNSPDLDLPALRMLDVSYNNLRTVQRDALQSLPLLNKLYLGNNFLQNLEEFSFAGLTRLQVLDVQNNQIAYVHPNLLKHMSELRELNLRNNKLNAIGPDVFQSNTNLKLLDVSRNQLKEISAGAFANSRELEVINASHNYIIHLPSSINGMKNLRILDVTNNRLGNVGPDLLSGLSSLTELRLSQNLLLELTTAAFDSLQFLKLLYIDNNELETIGTNAFRSLPALNHLKLNENELKDVPDFTFNNLPNLQVLELQENFIQHISDDAFHLVPHLLMLNLSHNLLRDMKAAGLKNLQSLEMLDVSYNRLMVVAADSNLEKMEWMIELKMDGNRICGVHGGTFNQMPRLRVLSLRNNNMMSFPETAVQRLRGNIAVLDIDGNPLACGCNLLWLRAWLQESSSLGPKCLDGNLLRESRLSREKCVQEHRLLEPVAPGCESELLTAPDSFETSQIFTPWTNFSATHMNLGNTNNLVPSPEESDYFYDEYVDYPYNDTMKPNSHLISGDTPTIYAAASKNKTKAKDVPKEVNDSPGSSGFTFFGVPLPSLGFNFLGGKKRQGVIADIKELTVEGKSAIVNEPVKQAQRKSAIINKPIRGSGSRGMYPPPLVRPHVETGGFVPILPGTGGFTPIINQTLKRPDFSVERLNVTVIDASDTKAFSTIIPSHKKTVPTTTESILKRHKIETKLTVEPTFETIAKNPDEHVAARNVTAKKKQTETPTPKSNLKPVELEQIKNISELLSTTVPTVIKSSTTTTHKPELETITNAKSFEDILETIEEASVSPSPSTNNYDAIEAATSTDSIRAVKNFTMPALLIPGGQLPQFRTAGRPTITKIPSPIVSTTPPMIINKEIVDVPPRNITEAPSPETRYVDNDDDDKSWYFASYNQTNLEPYVGDGFFRSYGNSLTVNSFMLMITIFVVS